MVNENEIWLTSVEKATAYLDQNPWHSKYDSKTGDLVFNGKLYPTKLVLEQLQKQIVEENLDIYIPTLTGGTSTFNFFEKLGFEVKRKNMSLKNNLLPYIERYKILISTNSNYSEIYKWEALANFKKHWNLGAANLPEMFEASFPGNNNLWSSNNYYPIAMLKGFSGTNPSGVAKAINDLLDETYSIESRIESYKKAMDILLKEDNSKRGLSSKMHYQDGRTIGLLLAFTQPDEYYLFKYNILKAFCNKFGLTAAKKGDTVNQIIINQDISNQIREILIEDTELLELHNKRLTDKSYREDNFHLLTQDFMYSIVKYLNGVAFDEENDEENDATDNKTTAMSLNQILYGPPGTGKTYNTINHALKIVDPEFYNLNKTNREELTKRFKELLIKDNEETKGQIAFCTFHQSFSYEDFVEGIKPKVDEKGDVKSVYYDIDAGIFKRICKLADSNNSTVKVIKEGKISWTETTFKEAAFFKLSLGEYNNPADRPIYEFCRDNNYIAIGFGQENDFTGLSESEIVKKCEELRLEVTAAQQMNYFIHYLKKNNYVIISNGNKFVRAIGKVVGDYEYIADSPIRYNHFRKVEWLFVDENIPISELYERGLSQKTMYKIDESALKQDFFTNQGQKHVIEDKEEKKYVLIIDEINRGNVSQIFGELITLIENDKRAGKDEELEVILPYSKEPFKVPENVYIIGTMNTADRSVEALDTALRRRFSFTEMMPEYDKLKNISFNGFTLQNILQIINERIELLLDRDHVIGHSYFINVTNEDDLKETFMNKIIPLLQEYFYHDYEKIALILGEGFVEYHIPTKQNNLFAKFSNTIEIPTVEHCYRLKENIEIIPALKDLLNLEA